MTVDEIIAGLNLTEAQVATIKRNLAMVDSNRLRSLTADVSRAEQGSVMTRAGLNILAKGIAGKPIVYTKAVIGDSMRNGEVVELTDAQIAELTDLINPLEELPLVDFKHVGNGQVVVQALLQNADFQDGFFCRELGLFAEDPDTNQEVLYSYRNTGLVSGYTPSGGGAMLLNLLLNLVTVVDNAQNVTAVLDVALLYISHAQFLEHINSTTPHPNLQLITLEDVDEQIQTAEIIQHLQNQMTQVETNVANLFMQLGSPDANLLIFEDFKDLQGIDNLKVKVLNAANGSAEVYVESLDGIQNGIYYTLSDGVRAQYIRSKATASNDGSFSVIFVEPVTKNFNLNKTYLYRSTAIIGDGQAGGSSNEYESTFAPDDIFSGVSSSTTKTISLNTKQSNAANFDLQGDGAFDANGFFTL
ncbi:MAG: hypothetical protein SR1Q5_00880 [Quinella sp. 1Q5]|nr:hypothetical protein [Quinella sp. 1Q5]